MKPPYNHPVNLRVNTKVYAAFVRKAKPHGTPSHVIRELVEAFAEDRVTIKPPSNKGTLYHVD